MDAAAFHLAVLSRFPSSDHQVKEKDREKKKDKNKEWKNHKLPPVHEIARENGEVVSPQKGRNKIPHWAVELKVRDYSTDCFGGYNFKLFQALKHVLYFKCKSRWLPCD